jgi:hypothetical protein
MPDPSAAKTGDETEGVSVANPDVAADSFPGRGATPSASSPVDRRRIEAASWKIDRVLARLPILGAFPTEKRLLEEARDLLDPEVKLA